MCPSAVGNVPVRGIQHRTGVQDDFPVTAEFLNGEDVAVVQPPPVVALTVARDPYAVPARRLISLSSKT